jgi:hypothetical protein
MNVNLEDYDHQILNMMKMITNELNMSKDVEVVGMVLQVVEAESNLDKQTLMKH